MQHVTARIEEKVDDIQEGMNDVEEITKVCSFEMNIYMLKFGQRVEAKLDVKGIYSLTFHNLA